jgi:hypothetical protein
MSRLLLPVKQISLDRQPTPETAETPGGHDPVLRKNQ